jgi:hypothetical protein
MDITPPEFTFSLFSIFTLVAKGAAASDLTGPIAVLLIAIAVRLLR